MVRCIIIFGTFEIIISKKFYFDVKILKGRCNTVESSRIVKAVVDEVKKVIVGKDEIIELMMMAIMAKGHILIEDVPGVGKTTLAMAFSKTLGMECNRVQFTPDILPSDVVGFGVYDIAAKQSEYKPGAIMCNLFLADEINRTSSKTQSALLQVMEEGKVTVDNVTRPVPKPFNVIATQNPSGSAGTQLLPESQLDRFMVRLSMGYPDLEGEIGVLKGRQGGNPIDCIEKVIDKEELIKLSSLAADVFVHDMVYDYMVKLVQKTRQNDMIELGISPRGTLALANMAKSCAFFNGRDYLTPDDVKRVFYCTAAHRIILKPKARISSITVEDIIAAILKETPAPRPVEKK